MIRIKDDAELNHVFDLAKIARYKWVYAKGEVKGATVTLNNAVVFTIVFNDKTTENLFFEYKKFDMFLNKFLELTGHKNMPQIESSTIAIA